MSVRQQFAESLAAELTTVLGETVMPQHVTAALDAVEYAVMPRSSDALSTLLNIELRSLTLVLGHAEAYNDLFMQLSAQGDHESMKWRREKV